MSDSVINELEIDSEYVEFADALITASQVALGTDKSGVFVLALNGKGDSVGEASIMLACNRSNAPKWLWGRFLTLSQEADGYLEGMPRGSNWSGESDPLSLNTYQSLAGKTSAVFSGVPIPRDAKSLIVPALGLAGEAGEFCDYLKKALGHGHNFCESKAIEELGDVLWYISEIALLMGISLETVAQVNLQKLKNRYPEGFSSEASINRVEVAGMDIEIDLPDLFENEDDE